MSRIREIQAIQEPFDLKLDDAGRAQVAFNISITKTPSDTLEEEVIKILTDASVGTGNTNVFFSKKKDIPNGAGPYLLVIATGGTFPEMIHNEAGSAWQRPTVQISVRAKSYTVARTMARAAYRALTPIRNLTVTP